mgnify:CR=1
MMVTCLIISSLTVRFVQIRLAFLIWTGFFCVSNESGSKLAIEPGDEIGIGKLKFIYR